MPAPPIGAKWGSRLDAFYSGAQGVLMVLDHLAQHGRIEEMHDTLRGGEARSFQGRGTDLLGVLDIAPLH